MKVILFQPQIPQNTGNIVRTCAVTGTGLILVHPLGFSITDRWLKRAGLDYWEGVQVEEIWNLEEYLQNTKDPFFFFSSHAEKLYTDVEIPSNALLIFGSETEGLPDPYWSIYRDRFITIPMLPNQRCLNLASSVAVAVYEGIRQSSHSTFLRP